MSRFLEFDIAKSICIILVVVGHYYPEFSPEWYTSTRSIIYSFHMPLFMFASGYIYIAFKKNEKYLTFLWKKVKRLMIPYFVTSIILITIKLLTQKSVYIENPVSLTSYLKIFYGPEAGYFLWFIWALWWMFVISPMFKTRKSRFTLFIIAIILHYIPVSFPSIFCIEEFRKMLIYFMLGIMLYDWRDLLKSFLNIPTWITCTSFIALNGLIILNQSYLSTNWGGDGDNLFIIKTLQPFMGIAFIMQLSKGIASKISTTGNWLLSISFSSYIIYLFHTTFEGFVKSIALKIIGVPTDDLIFIITAIIIILSGIILPIMLHKYIFNINKYLKLLFGLK